MNKVLPKSKLQVSSRGGLAGIGVHEITSQWWDGVWATEPGIRQLFQGVAFILKAEKDKSKLISIVRNFPPSDSLLLQPVSLRDREKTIASSAEKKGRDSDNSLYCIHNDLSYILLLLNGL